MTRVLKGLVPTAGFGGALSLCISLAIAQSSPLSERKSGFEFMSPESQATQRDDFSNPGMLWVAEGETLWNAKAGASGRSCAECHGDATVSMKGVAARYPAYFAESGRPIDLQSRINICRKNNQSATPSRLKAGSFSRFRLSLESSRAACRLRRVKTSALNRSAPGGRSFMNSGRAS
jgi:sulfur-oxidizing protein SoxA